MSGAGQGSGGGVAVSADTVRQLRERTGAGMMECKRALVECAGDLDAAAELMRKQGLAKADKKAARVAAEGVIVIERADEGREGRAAAMVEINCETDFVAREADFRRFAADVARLTIERRPVDLTALLDAELAVGETVDQRRRALVSKIGEHISVRRATVLTVPAAPGTALGAYVHGSRIGVLVALEAAKADPAALAALAHDLAMHIAASNPQFVAVADVPAEVIDKEREILADQARAQAQKEGKSPEVVAKMVEGRLRKALNEIVLLGQAFVKDPDQSVEKLLKGAGARVTRFERFEVGAGIERKQENFVAEVMAQVSAASGTPPQKPKVH